jgi:hypothetical protein
MAFTACFFDTALRFVLAGIFEKKRGSVRTFSVFDGLILTPSHIQS